MKYDLIMKEKKEALKAKRSLRGSVDNDPASFASDADADIHKPSLFINKGGPVSFKSRLHSELRQQDKEVRSKFSTDLEEKK